MARPEPITKLFRFTLLATIVFVVGIFYFAQEVLIPLALAALLSFLLAPLVTRLERWRFGRVPAVLTVVLSVFALITLLGYVVGVQVMDLADNIDQYRDNIIAKADAIRPTGGGVFGKLAKTAEEVQKKISQAEPATTQSTQPAAETSKGLGKANPSIESEPAPVLVSTEDHPLWVSIVEHVSPLTRLSNYLGLALGPLGTAGIVIVFVFFMLLQREDMRDRMLRLIGEGQLNVTTQALDDAASRISRYLMAQSIVNGTYGIAVSLGLWGIGAAFSEQQFPSFVLWGLLCGILRFIPYIGPWIGAAFPLAISLAVFPGFSVFVAVISMFVIIELISNNFMEPWLYGSSTGMSTVAILVSAVFWTWLWGPIGLLLSTPLTVCLVVTGKYVPSLQFLDVLLGDEPVFEPPVRVYQRLLALDQEEAMELLEDDLKERSLEEVYDNVLLPALALAEQDRHRGKLDDQRKDFIRQAMRDIIEELGDRERRMVALKAAELKAAELKADEAQVATGAPRVSPPAPPASGNGKNKSSGNEKTSGAPPTIAHWTERPKLPNGCVVNVLLLPAHDEADEIAELMLAQVLELRGYCAIPQSQTSLASEMVDSVAQKSADVILVSALPPAAVTHARYLCKRLHARYPDIKMVVGLWTIKGDIKKAKERITCEAEVELATTLAEALDRIHHLAAAKIMQSGTPNETPKVER